MQCRWNDRVQADKVLLVVEAVLEALKNAEGAQQRAKAAREDADSKVEQASSLLAQVSQQNPITISLYTCTCYPGGFFLFQST